mmetsp:Transcript_6250/g.10840  ORF Transcript_6250/g.10840 Transcript_6250/m.10840 type:complete len:183 (+) Transcript_6250:78-626(+)
MMLQSFASQKNSPSYPQPKASFISKASNLSSASFTVSERKLPYNETKKKVKQSEKQLELKVKAITRCKKGKRKHNWARRTAFIVRREIKTENDWRTEYQTLKGLCPGSSTYNYNPVVSTSYLTGPNLCLAKLQKYSYTNCPIAKYLRGKGSKFCTLGETEVHAPKFKVINFNYKPPKPNGKH